MDQHHGQLPPLPSERKSFYNTRQEISNALYSHIGTVTTTITSNELLKDRDKVEATSPSIRQQGANVTVPEKRATDKTGSFRISKFPNYYANVDNDDHKQEDILASREEQLERLGAYPPLPVSITSEYLLDYISTTTEFMNKFQYQVSQRFDEFHEKIDRIDRMVRLLESKKRVLEDEEGNTQSKDA